MAISASNLIHVRKTYGSSKSQQRWLRECFFAATQKSWQGGSSFRDAPSSEEMAQRNSVACMRAQGAALLLRWVAG